MMKPPLLLVVALMLSVGVLAGPKLVVTPPNGHITLSWCYDTNLLSTNLFFNCYETTNIVTPVDQWGLLTNVVGTNLSVALDIQPGAHFFVVAASNFWGESGLSSPPAITPPVAMPISSVKIVKSP